MLLHPAYILWFNIIITPFHTNSTPLYRSPLLDSPSKILTLVETSFHPLDTCTHLTWQEETAPPGSLVSLLIHDCWFQWAPSASNNPTAWTSPTLYPTPKRMTTQQLSSKPCLTPPPHHHGWSCFPFLRGAKKKATKENSHLPLSPPLLHNRVYFNSMNEVWQLFHLLSRSYQLPAPAPLPSLLYCSHEHAVNSHILKATKSPSIPLPNNKHHPISPLLFKKITLK